MICSGDPQLLTISHSKEIPYRSEKLEWNHRSTKTIVDFCQTFKAGTVLAKLSMDKHIQAPPKAAAGNPVRLLQGDWSELCDVVARELDEAGAGRVPKEGTQPPASAAILIFSTSERSTRNREAAALTLRRAIEARGVRAYNPRNKTAAAPESPVAELFGLISYLIDPITYAPAGKKGRSVMVAASLSEPAKRSHALSKPPEFRISEAHLEFQKKFVKGDAGDIGAPAPERKPLLDYLDRIRDELAQAMSKGKRPRLTLAGLVARLLTFERYRNCGFTSSLFRQAMFTTMLEANIAPTRLTKDPLDSPLEVTLEKSKYVWPKRFWALLNVFGSYLQNASLDEPEVEAFEQDAVLMITFHQGKGLEFDYVYVAGTGRAPDLSPALRTKLFSGEAVPYTYDGGELKTADASVIDLAFADREREVYVAMTRAKKALTILHDPKNDFAYMPLNPAIEKIFKKQPGKSHPYAPAVVVKEYTRE